MKDLSRILEHKISPFSIIAFIKKLYYSNKSEELLSFLVWELKYVLAFYKGDKTISFTDQDTPSILISNQANFKIKDKDFKITKSSVNWSRVYIDNASMHYGCTEEDPNILIVSSPSGITRSIYTFSSKITSLFVTTKGTILCCVEGIIFNVCGDTKTAHEVLKLTTTQSRFRQDAITETPNGDIFLGEYANVYERNQWKFVGYIYRSTDTGLSWRRIDFLAKEKINKHIHILKWSHLIQGLIMTDGDNQKNIWINQSRLYFDQRHKDPTKGWKKINKNHIQKGGHTAIAEVNGKILFGTDYNGGTNFIISTSDMSVFKDQVLPNPYRRAIFNRIVVKCDNAGSNQLWAVTRFRHHNGIKSLVAMSADQGRHWKKIIEYDATNWEINLISNSKNPVAMVYLSIHNRLNNTSKTYLIQ